MACSLFSCSPLYNCAFLFFKDVNTKMSTRVRLLFLLCFLEASIFKLNSLLPFQLKRESLTTCLFFSQLLFINAIQFNSAYTSSHKFILLNLLQFIMCEVCEFSCLCQQSTVASTLKGTTKEVHKLAHIVYTCM